MTPPFLRTLKAANFRSLKNVDVPLRRLSVLVGPNGSGKTNLLSLIGFLRDSARLDLGPALDRAGGFERVLFRGERDFNRVRIGVVAQVTKFATGGAPDEYSLTFSRHRLGGRAGLHLVRREEFSFKRRTGPGRRITISGAKVVVEDQARRSIPLREGALGLSTLPRLAPGHGGEQIAELADLFESLRVFEVDVAAARRPGLAASAEHLTSDASNLAAFLRFLRDSEPERFATLQDDARAMVPGLTAIELENVGGSAEGVVVHLLEEGLKGTTPLAEASFGTVRALALLALLHDPNPPKLTCIEEIDHGLHPHVFDLLVTRLREASERTQFLIATHSPALVNRLAPEELIVCERDPATGASLIPAIDSAEVLEMEKAAGPLRLGELWFSGVLGGALP